MGNCCKCEVIRILPPICSDNVNTSVGLVNYKTIPLVSKGENAFSNYLNYPVRVNCKQSSCNAQPLNTMPTTADRTTSMNQQTHHFFPLNMLLNNSDISTIFHICNYLQKNTASNHHNEYSMGITDEQDLPEKWYCPL